MKTGKLCMRLTGVSVVTVLSIYIEYYYMLQSFEYSKKIHDHVNMNHAHCLTATEVGSIFVIS